MTDLFLSINGFILDFFYYVLSSDFGALLIIGLVVFVSIAFFVKLLKV